MFYERFNELIKEKGISVRQFTKAANLPYSSVWAWQQGSQPTAEKIVIVADYFQVSADYLLGRENDIGIININANLTPFQNELLKTVSKLPTEAQYQVLGYAQAREKHG